MKQEASKDILLRPHASEIRRQALLYVYEVQARLTRQPSDLNAYCQEHNVAYPEIALPEVEQNMGLQGLVWNTTDGATIQIQGNRFDVKGTIHNMTTALLNRTH